jgi:hypothetical protein
MQYLNRIVIGSHMYIIGDKSVTLMNWNPKTTRTRANGHARARETYGISNALMPNMKHITVEQWREMGKHQRCKPHGKQWQLEDYCKYCTDFLIERPNEEDDDPCVQCGIRDTLQEEQRQYKAPDFNLRKSSAIQNVR